MQIHCGRDAATWNVALGTLNNTVLAQQSLYPDILPRREKIKMPSVTLLFPTDAFDSIDAHFWDLDSSYRKNYLRLPASSRRLSFVVDSLFQNKATPLAKASLYHRLALLAQGLSATWMDKHWQA